MADRKFQLSMGEGAHVSKKLKVARKRFGQLVIGPPGSGKTTYCAKMGEHLSESRNVAIVNLDPANDVIGYTPAVDVKTLISLEDVMNKSRLGPNGGLIYCMEYLEANVDWLVDEVNKLEENSYFIFDLPGQVELYSHYETLNRIVMQLQLKADLQLSVIHLVDSHHCSDAGKYISALMLSLIAMLRMGLPHVNILSKADILEKHHHKLDFGLDFYTEVLDLNFLLDSLDSDAHTIKYKKLNAALVSMVEDYSLVSFQLLNVYKESSLCKVKNLNDKVSGYVFQPKDGKQNLYSCAMGAQAAPGRETADYT